MTTVFETSMVGITTSEIGGNYTTANTAFQRMVGYAESEIRAMRPVDLTYDEDRPFTARQ
jgi:PAS domain S-box-containing protein